MATLCAAQTQTILYTFSGGNDGGVPYSSLVMDKEGNFYGTTQQYGDESCTFAYMGCGTVFELSPPTSGGEWVYKVLYAFQGYEDGVNPSSQLTLDDDGNLYGTTIMGGAGSNFTNCGSYGCGTVFELRKSGSAWTERLLHRFNGSDGNDPIGGVTFDAEGNLYGTTSAGGDLNCYYESPGCGVVFELIKPERTRNSWNENVLHVFEGADGSNPVAGVIIDTSANIYGATAWGGIGDPHTESGGVVFELRRTQNSWVESTLMEFPKNSGNPGAPLTLDKQGNLYGTTEHGGSYGLGSVFELTKLYADHGLSGSPNVAFPPLWKETDLYSFTGGADGGNPLYSGVVFDKGGNLYGTTEAGGSNPNCETNCGIIFQLTKGSGNIWQESEVFSFSGGVDGFYPFSGVIIGKDGLYGMTPNGGDPSCSAFSLPGCGVIYRISK